MAAVTHYFVQAYDRHGRKLMFGALRQAARRDAALGLALRVSRRTAGAIAYEVSGDPETDWWGEPVILGRYGRTPDGRGGEVESLEAD